MAIQSFKDELTHDLFHGIKTKGTVKFKGLENIIRRKLDMVHYAHKLTDLKSPPGNRLEALKRDWIGWYSIRINDQWRIIFQWMENGPQRVGIIDYHS
mgnify:CR=1 FL=1